MISKDREAYLERMQKHTPQLYFKGRRVESTYDHPCITPVVNAIGATYDQEGLELSNSLLYADSEIIGEQVNRHNHIFTSAEDARARVDLIRELSKKTGACTHRCVGIDALNALDIMTRKIDRDLGTVYHKRFTSFLAKIQSEDLAIAASMTDGKGNRMRKPGEQSDPDIYVHVVSKNEKGIIVRGAKAHQGRPMAVDHYLVLPGAGLGEGEEAYAVAFVTSCDTPGVKIVLGQGPHELYRVSAAKDDIGNYDYGLHIGNLLIFDDVFIPWEQVFLCGETSYVGELIETFSRYHRMATGGCKAGLCDLIAGVANAIAGMNGLAKASHVRDKLIQIMKLGETAYGCSIAAATLGERTSDGNFIPDSLMANVAKLHSADAINQSLVLLQDITGALVATLPSVQDLESEDVGHFIRKYLASDDWSCEDKFKLFRLAQNLIFGVQGLVAVHGGGSPQIQKMSVLFQSDLKGKTDNACKLAGIR